MSTLELLKEVRLPRWLAENKGLPRAVVIDEILQETARAVLVRVRPVVQASDHCHRCGQEITNPVSLVVGYGPECCEHIGLPRPDRVTAEEMMAAAAGLPSTEIWLPRSVLGLDRTSGFSTLDEPASPGETELSEARDFFHSVLAEA